jgi:hypothetical protein
VSLVITWENDTPECIDRLLDESIGHYVDINGETFNIVAVAGRDTRPSRERTALLNAGRAVEVNPWIETGPTGEGYCDHDTSRIIEFDTIETLRFY